MWDPYITNNNKKQKQDFKDLQQKGQSEFFDLAIIVWFGITLMLRPLPLPSLPNPHKPSLGTMNFSNRELGMIWIGGPPTFVD